ncbi:DNA methyl transferase8 [Zea mays]|jgi:hypothetical protein|uniref:DNA methyl transferase8 n=1 Tax=Zea mays TaxID=4577 RepID=A0A1D6HTZ6_MAIZE|nr:DNA methyl transferase8 [Zea mays]
MAILGAAGGNDKASKCGCDIDNGEAGPSLVVVEQQALATL